MIDQTLISIAKSICPLLEGEWLINQDLIDQNYPGVFITNLAGKQLQFKSPWNNEERLEISGSFLDGLNSYLSYHSNREKTEITVAKSKSPEQIARDIRKRLMPAYERVLAQAKKNKIIADKQEAKKQNVLECLKEAMDKATIRDNKVYQWEPYEISAKYHYSEENIELKLTLSLSKALSVLQLFKD